MNQWLGKIEPQRQPHHYQEKAKKSVGSQGRETSRLSLAKSSRNHYFDLHEGIMSEACVLYSRVVKTNIVRFSNCWFTSEQTLSGGSIVNEAVYSSEPTIRTKSLLKSSWCSIQWIYLPLVTQAQKLY